MEKKVEQGEGDGRFWRQVTALNSVVEVGVIEK